MVADYLDHLCEPVPDPAAASGGLGLLDQNELADTNVFEDSFDMGHGDD